MGSINQRNALRTVETYLRERGDLRDGFRGVHELLLRSLLHEVIATEEPEGEGIRRFGQQLVELIVVGIAVVVCGVGGRFLRLVGPLLAQGLLESFELLFISIWVLCKSCMLASAVVATAWSG